MTSKREQVLAQLFTVIDGISGPTAERNAVLPTKVGSGGLLILRDGDPGEPEILLSPRIYAWRHEAQLEVFMQDATGAEAAFDTLLTAIGSALAADRTLGGLCDWVEASAPAPADLPIDGAMPFKAVILTITLHYDTTDPLA